MTHRDQYQWTNSESRFGFLEGNVETVIAALLETQLSVNLLLIILLVE